jgi:hypothetical protein
MPGSSRRSLAVAILLTLVCMSLPSAKAEEFIISDWVSPTLANLFSVYMVNASEGWAVGQGGTVIHWNGTQWMNSISPTNNTLFSVSMVNVDDGWAVGQDGIIIHWNGTTWQAFQSPTLFSLCSVCMVNAADGWAVGQSGAVIHWNGTLWMNFTSPTSATLFSVSMVDVNYGWAMGYDWIQWNGTSWEQAPGAVAIPNIDSVYIVDSNDGWAVGGFGSIWHWDGTQWNETESSTMYEFFSVFMTSADDGWAVGEWGTLVPPNAATVALHWNGTQWTDVGGPTKRPLNSVYMIDSNDGWAVGSAGTIIHWNGVQWIPEYQETTQIVLGLFSMLIALVLTRTALKGRKSFFPVETNRAELFFDEQGYHPIVEFDTICVLILCARILICVQNRIYV